MSSFRLQSGDANFNSRVDALFASLQTAAVDLQPQMKRPHEDEEEPDEGHICRANEDDSDRHEFRRPRGFPPSRRGRRSFGPRNNTPDYVKNPQKWTRYSMKDTKVLSDRENTKVGLKLLDELRTRRMEADGQEDQEPSGVDNPKILFKKPAKVTDDDDKETEEEDSLDNCADALFGGVKKFKKTEYVVGKSKQHKVKKADIVRKVESEAEAADKQIKLGHLSYEEEEEEEEDE